MANLTELKAKNIKPAEKGWRKLRGFRRLDDVINGIKFIDGIDEKIIERQRNAA